MITELDKLTLDDCAFINADCMEGLKRLPDKCIDLAVVDPPYGIGIGHTIMLGIGGVKNRSKATIHTYGDSTKALAKQNFIIPLTIHARRTKGILRNLKEYQRTVLFGAATSFLTIWAKHRA